MLNLEGYIYAALLIIIAVVCIVAIMLNIENAHLKIINTGYQAEIMTLKQQSQAAIEQASQAQTKAVEQMKSDQAKDTGILRAQVSPKCKDAIKWGIQQGQAFA